MTADRWNDRNTYTAARSLEGYNAVRVCGRFVAQNVQKPQKNETKQGYSDFPTVSDFYRTAWTTL